MAIYFDKLLLLHVAMIGGCERPTMSLQYEEYG
jgi:hypothetical protein